MEGVLKREGWKAVAVAHNRLWHLVQVRRRKKIGDVELSACIYPARSWQKGGKRQTGSLVLESDEMVRLEANSCKYRINSKK